MKILIAVDESQQARETINSVLHNARPQQAEVRILHVRPVTNIMPPQMSRGYAPELEEIEREMPKILDAMATQLRTAGFQVETVIDSGETRTVIIDMAETWKADLIVLGSRGNTGLPRLLLGSVAESVVRHAPCSVLVVRKPQ
jgi:nucleotide-binding universal stress UspA family protein